jgi:asparagine synthase (glutamine-hydrolysing)
MFRYLAFVWDADRLERAGAVRDWERRLQRDGSWKSVLSAKGVGVWIADSVRHFKGHTLPAGAGIVLGEIYERQRDVLSDAPAKPAVFTEDTTREVLADRGLRLMSQYWGNYVALLLDPQLKTTLVLKDPAGSLPCYVAACRGVQVIFSHLADCLDLQALQLRANWNFVRSRIANDVFEVENDPWVGVSSVRRGECLRSILASENLQRGPGCY